MTNRNSFLAPRRTKLRLPALCVVLPLLSGLPLACKHDDASAADAPTPVRVRLVEPSAAPGLARFSGSLEPAIRVDLAFRVGGYVQALGQIRAEDGSQRNIEKGDFVKKDSVLARIRSADYAQKVATTSAELSEAKAQAKLADAELERARRMLDSLAISRADFDGRAARAESAKTNVDAAAARQGEVGVALADTILRAPMDGVVLNRSVEVGTLVAPGETAITVADVRNVKAVFAVPQTLVEKLKEGSPVQVFVGTNNEGTSLGKALDATITRIAPSADSKGRSFAIEAALPNESGTLRTGSVVSVRVPEAVLSGPQLVVPLSAVVRSPADPRGFSVFVLDGTSDRAPARLHNVHLGEILGNSVTVSDGLTLGQRVVTVGATMLHDGSEARVIR